MINNKNNAEELIELAKCISEKMRYRVGIKTLTLHPENVPPSVRPLLRHAEILGIGDDGTREDIFNTVPPEYLDLVRNVIGNTSGLFDWYRSAETTDAKHSPEVAAVGWMLFGLNLG